MAEDELTPESLQEQLNSYHKAIAEEFETKTSAVPEKLEEYTSDYFKQNVHFAARQIVWLSANAESETVRANCSKFVIQQAFADSEKDGDPIRDLMNELTKPKAERAVGSS